MNQNIMNTPEEDIVEESKKDENNATSTKRDIAEEKRIEQVEIARSMYAVTKNPFNQFLRFGSEDGKIIDDLPDASEWKMFYFLISKVKPDAKELTPIEFTLKDYCDIIGIDSSNGSAYRNIKATITKLGKRLCWFHDQAGNEYMFRYIDDAILLKKGVYSILIGKKLERVLTNINGKEHSYTKFLLKNILPLSSKYSIALYTYFKSVAYGILDIELTIEELKNILGIKKETYTDFKELNRKILKPALAEINKFTDLNIEVSYDRRVSTEITHLLFRIHEVYNQKEKYLRNTATDIALTPKKELHKRYPDIFDKNNERIPPNNENNG